MTISSEITSILNDLGSRLGVVVDWSSANVVPYVQELVSRIAKLTIANNAIAIGFGVLSLIIAWVLGRYLYKNRDELDFSYDVRPIMLIGLVVCLVFAGLIIIPMGATEITQAIYLPEMTAIEYIQKLTR